MARHDYGPLRDAHQRALDELNSHSSTKGKTPDAEERRQALDALNAHVAGKGRSGHEAEQKERAPDEPSRSPGWTHEGGMVEQQASANKYDDWVNQKNVGTPSGQKVDTAAARAELREALNQQIGTHAKETSRTEKQIEPDVTKDTDIER